MASMNRDAANADSDLTLICGPSSCGKSTYVDWAVANGRLPKDGSLYMGFEYANLASLPGPVVLHYNTLRALDLELAKMRAGQANRYGEFLRRIDLKADPAWQTVLEHRGNKRAVVLLTREAALWRRVASRELIEPSRTGTLPYPKEHWLSHCRRIDLAAHYAQVVEELEREQIPYEIVDTESDGYPPIRRLADVSPPIRCDLSRLTRDELQQLIADPIFEYQKVQLPYGLETTGQERTKTLPLIFPPSLEGKSVLDVGCALGYFCFEAEARDAARIVGLERMERRFEAAWLLGRIKSSKAEFLFHDVQEDRLDEPFDVVLLLNVIHHLCQPFRVISRLARITRELLAIEFPGLSDVRFRQTVRKLPRKLDRYPLIGVSSLGQADQTFVYSPVAMQRILTEMLCDFQQVDIVPSPMPDRFIARCWRTAQKPAS